jgi:sarcosine oxidase subunit gamma
MGDVYETTDGGYRLRRLPTGRIWVAVSFGAPLAGRLAALAPQPFALREAGPRAWLIVDDDIRPFAEAERDLAPDGALVDISHGRARYEIDGPRARAKLATGTAVDISSAAFAQGAASETMFNHIGIHLTRTGPDRFEILTGLSFADSLWRELTE